MRAAIAWALPLAMLAAGCSLVEEPKAKEVGGPTDGYLANSPFLKVYVKSNSSGDMVLLDFDRRDWYVSKIADMIDAREVRFLTAVATPRNVIGEYLIDRVAAPAQLEQYRYSAMSVSEEEKLRMDAEFDALIERLAAQPAPTLATPSPALPVPAP